MKSSLLALSLLTLASCTRGPEPQETGDSSVINEDSAVVDEVDADGDGVSESEDCDDNDASRFPGNTETCDGVDNDCDLEIDNGATDESTFYADADGDGFGTDGTVTGCEAPEGYADDSGDCDDDRDDIYPGATEDNCADPTDYNCDGSTGYADEDSDGSPACEDCNDTDAEELPGGTEVCGDGKDNDCSGDADGTDATDVSTFYADADGDGAGDASVTTEACTAPDGYVESSNDCNDGDADELPGGTEVCGDGKDNDCSGDADGTDATDVSTFYADADGDGAGDASATTEACSAPDGYVSSSDDCDDGSAAISPSATEVPLDGIDNDCADGDDDDVLIYSVDRYDDLLYAVNRTDGTKAWEVNFGADGIDVAVGPDGTLYLGGYNNGALYTINPTTQEVSTLVSGGLGGVHGVQYDFETNKVVATVSSGARIVSIDPSTGDVADLVTGIPGLGLAIDAIRLPGETKIWITDRSNSQLLLHDPDSNTTEVYADLPIAPNLFVHDNDGGFYITATNGVVHVNPRLDRVRLISRTGINSYGGCADPMPGGGLILGDHTSFLHLYDVNTAELTEWSEALGTTWGCETSMPRDLDGDGAISRVYGGTDCNDADAAINPSAADTSADGIDQDCDFVDGPDADGDGSAATSVGGTDCDDSDAAIHLGTSGCTAATSCEAIRQAAPSAPDGIYSIDPLGTGAFDVFCDMTTDGGGWTRVVNIQSDSIAHGDNADAYGDITDADAAAKLSDEAINALTTGGYWRFQCGTTENSFVTNAEGTWTSMKSNTLDWSLDNGREGEFECAANRDGYVFSDWTACGPNHTDYVAKDGLSEGGGCYVQGEGWNLDGTLWAR